MSAALAETKPEFLRDLPPFPQVALRAIQVLAADDYQAKAVADIIASDPAFASELLRVSNSPLFGMRQQVKTLRHAIVVVGRDQLRALTMTVAMKSYLKAPLRSRQFQRCWQHSLATALFANGLASVCGVNPNEAYTAGLLHDIGKFALLITDAKEYQAMLKSEPPSPLHLLRREENRFGTDHCRAGWWLQKDWGLPKDLVESAACHHDDPPVPSPETPYALKHVVGLACRLATALGFETHKTGGVWTVEDIAAHLPQTEEDSPRLRADLLREAVETKLKTIC